MTLHPHVVSLDLALALRDAGYPQSDSLFIWTRAWTRKGGTLKKDGKWYIAYNQYHGEGNLAAPLASELMATMPEYINDEYYLTLEKCHEFYRASYSRDSDRGGLYADYKFEDVLSVNALARLFLHLRKASLI